MLRGPSASLCLTLAATRLGLSRAQIYPFQSVAVPPNRSLETLYAFYVYSHDEAPETPLGAPFVKFHGLVSHSTAPSVADSQLRDYKGVQLSIVRYKDFWQRIDPLKFCSTLEDVKGGRSDTKDQLLVNKPDGGTYSDADVYAHTVRFPNGTSGQTKDTQFEIKKTGVYVLVFSNCGTVTQAVISGSVIVKNSYGFLPGNEYHKLPFYGWLLCTYVVLALIWLVLSLRWWKELFNIQNCIAAVIFFGLVEAFLWYVFFNDWNNTGVRGKVFILALLFTVVKSTFSYMLVLVASLGWGVTRPYLDGQVVMRIQLLTFLYIILDFIREAVLSYRHSHSLSIAFVLLCLLPVSLLNGAIFFWIFTALSNLMETLRERRQTEKLQLFRRLWEILICSLAIATFSMLFQIFSLSKSISNRWRTQWLFADGISHILFLFVLMCMMYLWAPHKYSQRYAYSQQIDELENPGSPEAGAVWAEEDIPEDDESFWAATHQDATLMESSFDKKPVVPEVIGVPIRDDAEDGHAMKGSS